MSAIRPFPASEIEIMDEELEMRFFNLVQEGTDIMDVIQCLAAEMLPSKKVLRTIIFQLLMKSDDIKCIAFASAYLKTLVNCIPPKTDDLRTHYYDSIRDCRGYLGDLWTVFKHIVNSCFYHSSIYAIEGGDSKTGPIKYPNCKFLLEFYMHLFKIDYEYRFQPCLMMLLLWPGHEIRLSDRTKLLLAWIKDLYGDPRRDEMGTLLKCLHQALILMVKCFSEAKFKLSEAVVFGNPSLLAVVEHTMNHCKNVFANRDALKIFFAFVSLNCFRARVSERIIKQYIKKVPKRTHVLTLKDIVHQCMFPQKINKFKKAKPRANKEKNVPKRLPAKKTASSDKITGRDSRGHKPSDWSTSEETRDQPDDSSQESNSTTGSSLIKEGPNLRNFKEYSIYIQALNCLLCSYCHLFNVVDYVWKKNTVVKCHASKQCCHYLGEGVCSEDASVALQMPELVAALEESLQKKVKKLGINIDVELIPLQAFASSLTPS